ncbi:hypothetical protein VS884_25935, partial [Escherichia coli]
SVAASGCPAFNNVRNRDPGILLKLGIEPQGRFYHAGMSKRFPRRLRTGDPLRLRDVRHSTTYEIVIPEFY